MTWRSARLALGAASALGLGRFAFGLLVPGMRDNLGWSLGQTGAMSTANGLGYLLGAVVTAVLARRLTATDTFRLGMVLCGLTLAATAFTGDYAALLAIRAATGVASALVYITGGVLATRIAGGQVYFAGAGLGVALSGATVPALLDGHAERWPIVWIGLAAAAAVSTVVSWGAAASSADTASGNGRSHVRPLWRLAVAYLLFGAGYITYITFLSAYLADQHARTGQVALTWTLLGLAAVAGPAVWRRPAPAALLVTLAAAAALPLLWSAPIVVVASALAYGATFMGVPTAVTALVRDATPPVDWTATLSAFTAVFAASQLAGPWAAGALADRTGPGATLAWTAALCALAALFVLRRPAITHRPGTAESSSTAGEPAVPGWTGIPYGAFR